MKTEAHNAESGHNFGYGHCPDTNRPMRAIESPYMPDKTGFMIRARSFYDFGVPPRINYYDGLSTTQPSILHEFDAWFEWAKKRHEVKR